MDEPAATIEGTTLVSEPAALQWWEAVAVILQLAETLIEQAGATGAPDLPHIRLSTDGTIAILSGSEPSDQPVTRLADTLKLLLQNAATPPELARFVTGASEGVSADQDVGHFMTALHYFERPARQRVLQNVVERITTVEAQARITQELERLRVKARDAAMAHPTAKSEPSPNRRRWVRAVAALVAVVILLGGSAVAWLMFRPALTQAGNGVRSVVTQASQGVSRAFTRSVDRLFGDRGQEQVPSPTGSAPSAPKPASPGRTRQAKAQDIADPQAAAGGQAGTSVPLLPTLPPTVLAAPDAFLPIAQESPSTAAEPDPESDRIYSRLDPDVTPPVPVQPLLGRPTTDAIGIPGDMDILIDRTGAVERVTLLMPSRYQDRMLVYAIKARKFAPALAHGHPVRYLLRIRTAY